MASLSEEITFTTVLVEAGDETQGRQGTGTGFIFQFINKGDRSVFAIVTNKHVVEGATATGTILRQGNDKGEAVEADGIGVNLGPYSENWIPHPDPEIDLCICPVAPALNALRKRGITPHFRTFDTSFFPSEEDIAAFNAVEDIVMVGYPIGLWDHKNKLPIVRRGITATHIRHDYQGSPMFMIDAACFPGSSGSPVFIMNEGMYTQGSSLVAGNRIKFLGVLYAGPVYTTEGEIQARPIPTSHIQVTRTSIPTNLGYVIKSRCLLEFEPILESMIENASDDAR